VACPLSEPRSNFDLDIFATYVINRLQFTETLLLEGVSVVTIFLEFSQSTFPEIEEEDHVVEVFGGRFIIFINLRVCFVQPALHRQLYAGNATGLE